MQIIEDLVAHGHPNVTATHTTTLEITRESLLTKRGDCIVAVEASKALKDFSMDFRMACMHDDARIVVYFRAAGVVEVIKGRGSHLLVLTHSGELVIRKSTYVTDRTLMIKADKAAIDLSRQLVSKLKSASTIVKIRLIVEV